MKEWRKYLPEDTSRKINIFLDMDGVLVDFPSALKEHIKGVYKMDPRALHPSSKSSRRAVRQLQKLNLTDEGIDDLYNRSEHNFQTGGEYSPAEKIMSTYVLKALLGNKDLWLAMKKLDGADEVEKKAFESADEVYVLTAQVDKTSEEAKHEWIARHFPQISPDRVNVDRDKGGRLRQLIEQGTVREEDLNILIDDRQKFIDSFEGAGGVGIQYNFETPGEAFSKLQSLIGN